MKTPGEYALDWANGATFPELVAAIRAEMTAELAEDCRDRVWLESACAAADDDQTERP